LRFFDRDDNWADDVSVDEEICLEHVCQLSLSVTQIQNRMAEYLRVGAMFDCVVDNWAGATFDYTLDHYKRLLGLRGSVELRINNARPLVGMTVLKVELTDDGSIVYLNKKPQVFPARTRFVNNKTYKQRCNTGVDRSQVPKCKGGVKPANISIPRLHPTCGPLSMAAYMDKDAIANVETAFSSGRIKTQPGDVRKCELTGELLGLVPDLNKKPGECLFESLDAVFGTKGFKWWFADYTGLQLAVGNEEGWGDTDDLVLISQALGVRFCVHSDITGPWGIGCGGPVVHVLNQDNRHWRLLWNPKGYTSRAPWPVDYFIHTQCSQNRIAEQVVEERAIVGSSNVDNNGDPILSPGSPDVTVKDLDAFIDVGANRPKLKARPKLTTDAANKSSTIGNKRKHPITIPCQHLRPLAAVEVKPPEEEAPYVPVSPPRYDRDWPQITPASPRGDRKERVNKRGLFAEMGVQPAPFGSGRTTLAPTTPPVLITKPVKVGKSTSKWAIDTPDPDQRGKVHKVDQVVAHRQLVTDEESENSEPTMEEKITAIFDKADFGLGERGNDPFARAHNDDELANATCARPLHEGDLGEPVHTQSLLGAMTFGAADVLFNSEYNQEQTKRQRVLEQGLMVSPVLLAHARKKVMATKRDQVSAILAATL
jgi:hypothetical protein